MSNMSITLTVEGVERTLGAFNKYDMETREAIRGVVSRTSKAIAKEARARAPVGPTGNLRKSIKARKVKTMDGLSMTVAPRQGTAPHRHLVHEGTGQRTQHSTGRNVGRMTANPFMLGAIASQQEAYRAEIRRIVNRNVII